MQPPEKPIHATIGQMCLAPIFGVRREAKRHAALDSTHAQDRINTGAAALKHSEEGGAGAR
jgi:hypothetical protein